MITDESIIERKIEIGKVFPPGSCSILRQCIDNFTGSEESLQLLDVWHFRGNGNAAELPEGMFFQEIFSLDDLQDSNDLQYNSIKNKLRGLSCWSIFKKEPIVFIGKIKECFAFLDMHNRDLMMVRPEHLEEFLSNFVHTGKNLLKAPYNNKTVLNQINDILEDEDLMNLLVLVKKI